MKNIYLLPYKSKPIGIAILIIGIVLTYIRFSIGIKPEYLNQKVFALYSSFIEKKYFVITTNNIFEEICGLLILFGLIIIAFSKEKIENAKIHQIRLYSLLYSVYTNFFIIIISMLFVYGLGFINFLVINMYLVLVLHIIFFKYFLHKSTKILDPPQLEASETKKPR